MYLLRTLGAVGLYREAAGEFAPVTIQPKRLALLTFLARAEFGVCLRRDALIAVFWPESDPEHARGALRQALRGLRQVFGDGVLVTRGEEEIGTAPAALLCDAGEFEREVAAGDFQAALAHYRGDFLEGFHIGEATPEFEQWVDAERIRLRRSAARAVRAAADAAERTGDVAGAADWARRASELAPDDETALVRVLGLMDRQGNRAGALAIYESFRRRLSESYDTEPSPETRAQVAVIRSREVAAAAVAQSRSIEQVRPSGDVVAVPDGTGAQKRLPRTVLLAAVIGAALTLALAATLARPAPFTPRLDSKLVVVAPFRLSAAEPALAYVREGVANLLASALTGEGGLRAMDSRAVLASWRGRHGGAGDPTEAEALRLATEFGAAGLAEGTIVAAEGQVALTASLLAVPGGEIRTEAAERGPIDSLGAVVERLAADLLVGDARDVDRRLASSVPLAALRAYLEGRTALRRGDWGGAVEHFDRALTIDSTFASAALELRSASLWLDGLHAQRGESVAWRFRDRLSERERTLFLTELGPNYPAWYPLADRMVAWRALLASDWASAKAWSRLGSLYYSNGARFDVPDLITETRIALERALELDSMGGEPLRVHLSDLAAVTGDRALLDRISAASARNDSSGAARAWHRWLRAFTARDSAALRDARTSLPQMNPADLRKVWSMTQRAGYAVEDAIAAVALLGQAKEDRERGWAPLLQYHLSLNRGHPTEAQKVVGEVSPEWPPLSRLALPVLAALYGDGDSVAGLVAARALAGEVERPLADDAAERRSQVINVCVAEQWSLARGDTRSVDRAIAKLRMPEPGGPAWAESFYDSCATIIEAWRAVLEHQPRAPVLLERMDSLMRSGTCWHWSLPEHRAVARIWEQAGNPARALIAVRRRRFDSAPLLAADLREEGRLAALTGDTTGAVRAYRHYLVLRVDPEPALRAQRDSVRVALARLESAAP